MSNSVQIRPMRPDDREFTLSLAARLASVGMPPWRDPSKMRAFHRHYAEATINADGEGEAVYVAESAGIRAGVVHVLETKSGLTGEKQGYVATLAVTAEAAGQGIGRALMNAAETWCRERGLHVISLEVFAQNDGARNFYDRLGYRAETLTMVKILT